jgi:hypothetical protein
MNEAEIKAIVDQLADVAPVLHEADPADKAEVFRQLTSRQADGSSKRDRQRPGSSSSGRGGRGSRGANVRSIASFGNAHRILGFVSLGT